MSCPNLIERNVKALTRAQLPPFCKNKLNYNMAKIGKLKPIPKNEPKNTLGGSLKDNGFDRFPGTRVSYTPFKDIGGKYRTGLDPDASYLRNLTEEDQKIEKARIKADLKRLQNETSFDLSPKSDYYNVNSSAPDGEKVTRVFLNSDGITLNLENPEEEITWHWLKAHPAIAPSLEKYKRGEAFSGALFYVEDSEEENRLEFNRLSKIDKAISDFRNLSPTRQRQVCRMLGIYADANTKPEELYLQVHTLLNSNKVTSGKYQGSDPVNIFNGVLSIDLEMANVKDLIAQAIQHAVWYVKKQTGAVYEGENKIADNLDELEVRLSQKANQDELLALEVKLRTKKILIDS
jgi:hypothetical protein